MVVAARWRGGGPRGAPRRGGGQRVVGVRCGEAGRGWKSTAIPGVARGEIHTYLPT